MRTCSSHLPGPCAAFFCALLLAIASASPARAQIPSATLIGGAVQATASELVVLVPCTFPVSICTSVAAPVGAAGGTAYDAGNQLYWHTNGATLESSLVSFPCDLPCQAASPVSNASGLAFDARTRSLWILGLAPELARTSVPPGGTCPQVQSQCSLANVIPPGTVAAGLACSEKRDLLFYSASSGGPSPINLVFVASTANPCQPICQIDLGPAFGAAQPDPITGLGYDDCDDELFAVAGRSGIVRARLSFPGCVVLAQSLCVPPGGYAFHGLCLEAMHPAHVGRSCTSPPCLSNCSPRLVANDASLGNSLFTLSIASAPAPGLAIPFANLGPCGAGVPGLCGTIYPTLSPPPVTLPLMTLPGSSPCTGSGSLPIPMAATGSLCGLELCVQAVLVCPGNGLGLTNALSIRVVGA